MDADDVGLAAWWATLRASGDLGRLFLPAFASWPAFRQRFAPPTVAWWATDAAGPWMVCWATPWLSGALWALWVRPSHRGRRASWVAMQVAFREAFARWPVLICVTRQPRVARLWQHVGGQPLGLVPGLADGRAWVGWLTAETLREAQPRRAAVLAGKESD